MAFLKSESTLRSRLLSAGLWTVMGYGAGQVIRFGGSLITTRLILPEMFGVMAIVITVILILEQMSNVGIAASVIRSERALEPDYLSTAWILQIMRGGILWGLSILAAIVIAFLATNGVVPPDSVFANADLPLAIAICGFGCVITGLRSPVLYLAIRNLALGRTVAIELIAQVVSLTVTVTVAFYNPSIWALVSAYLVGASIGALLSHVVLAGPKFRIHWHREYATEIISLGGWLMVSSLFSVLAQRGDRLILGLILSPTQMGLFAIATLSVEAVKSVIARQADSMFYPAISEVLRERPEDARSIYYKFRRYQDGILFFVSGTLVIAGDDLIRFFYNANYRDAGPILQILSISIFFISFNLSGPFLLAKGYAQSLAVISFVRAVVVFSILPIVGASSDIYAAIAVIACLPLVDWLTSLFYLRKLEILDFRREFVMVPVLGVGMLCGLLGESLIGAY